MRGSASSQSPDSNGFVTGLCQLLEDGCRGFEVRQDFGRISVEESLWNHVRTMLEEFRAPNQSLGVKMQIPALLDFNAGICVFDAFIADGQRWLPISEGKSPIATVEFSPGLKPAPQKIPA